MQNVALRGIFFSMFMAVTALAGCGSSGTSNTTGSALLDGGVDLAEVPSGDLAMSFADLAAAPGDMIVTGCQLVPQSGCTTSQKCTTHDAVTTLCDPNGSVNRGERCTTQNGIDSCYAAAACANAGGGIGLCRSFCRTDNDCGTRSFCELPLGTAGIRLCTQACNALGAGCPTGLACYAYNKEHTDCRLVGSAAEGQACVRPEDCQAGLACLGPLGGESCRKLCPRGNSATCAGTKICRDVTYSDGTVWPTYGVCL